VRLLRHRGGVERWEVSEDLKAAWERAESAEHRLKQLETSLRRLMRLLRPRPQDPDRKLIGWRIVRNHPETGEREWLSPVGDWYASLSRGETFCLKSESDRPWLTDRAKLFKGRVVAVYLRVVKR
jgi:hypothetical protein